MRWFLRSKIFKATVSEANINYEGSITIDEELIKKSGLKLHEKVLVSSLTSGNRLETYVLSGKKRSGVICMNGAAAHLIKKGEKVIIMGFELSAKPVKASKILVDKQNKFIKYL